MQNDQAMRWSPRVGARQVAERLGEDEAIHLLCLLLAGDVSMPELGDEPWRGLLRDISGVDTGWMYSSDRHEYWPRAWAGRALCYIGDQRATAALIEATGDAHWRVRMNAVRALGLIGGDGASDAVITASQDAHPRVRSAAATSCGSIGDDRAFDILANLMSDSDGRVVARADAALERLSRSE
jgi:HEAT repeat protein